MIGRLRGILAEKQPPELLVDVGGVGYEVEAPMSTFYRLPARGSEVSLYTHLVVREDAQLLYAFATSGERRLFRALIRVSGVGPKLALALLSGIEAEEFARCVMADDTAALVRLPGVGKKTAQRLIMEMRDRMADWSPRADEGSSESPAVVDIAAPPPGLDREAESALIALGYKPAQASRAVALAARSLDQPSLEALIRQALKDLA